MFHLATTLYKVKVVKLHQVDGMSIHSFLFRFPFYLDLAGVQEQNEENESSAFDELGKLGEEMDFLPEAKLAFIGTKRKGQKLQTRSAQR